MAKMKWPDIVMAAIFGAIFGAGLCYMGAGPDGPKIRYHRVEAIKDYKRVLDLEAEIGLPYDATRQDVESGDVLNPAAWARLEEHRNSALRRKLNHLERELDNHSETLQLLQPFLDLMKSAPRIEFKKVPEKQDKET